MAGEVKYILRAEGVNFDATLHDTQDLSTIRGAGLALLELEHPVKKAIEARGFKAHKVYSGASEAVFRFEAPPGSGADVEKEVRERLGEPSRHDEPFQHLSFVVDVVEGDDETGAFARNKGRQFREWTVPLPEFNSAAQRFDEDDRVRPATRGKASASTYARHEFGRNERQRLYHRVIRDPLLRGFFYADSFEDLVLDTPAGLPLSPQSRMAVVYADGNSFRKARSAVGAEEFSQRLDALRSKLMERILRWYRGGAIVGDPRFVRQVDGETRLRLETLLWGGDELIFVMPSWLALAFVEGFFKVTEGWKIGNELTHTVGVVICHYKTPIRQARWLAEKVVDQIKDEWRERKMSPVNAVGIEIFESLVPPEDDLANHRRRSYGEKADVLELAFPGDLFAELLERMRKLADEGGDGLPRSQLYRILRAVKAAAKDDLSSQEASVKAREEFADYETRVRKADRYTTERLRLPGLPDTRTRSLAIELALVAGLWDYANPFADDPLPEFQ